MNNARKLRAPMISVAAAFLSLGESYYRENYLGDFQGANEAFGASLLHMAGALGGLSDNFNSLMDNKSYAKHENASKDIANIVSGGVNAGTAITTYKLWELLPPLSSISLITFPYISSIAAVANGLEYSFYRRDKIELALHNYLDKIKRYLPH